MKVILAAKSVYPFHPVGGVQKYVYYFAKHLMAQGVDVEIVAPLDGGRPRTEMFEGIKYTLISPAIFRYLELPIGWLGVHWFGRRLARYLKSQDFDILHSFDMVGLYYLKVRNRKPVIAQIFSDNYLCNPISFTKYLSLLGLDNTRIKGTKVMISPFASLMTILHYPAQYFLKTRPMHRCLTLCEHVFLEADCFRDEVMDLFRLDPAKLSTLPVGVDLTFARCSLQSATLTKAHLGFNPDDLVLLTVNRLAADKGIDKIIDALEIIREQNPHVKLVILGRGYQERELLALVAADELTEQIRLVQNVDEKDLYGYYKIADLYVCAFSYPGSSVSCMEAMASGLPILTTAQPWLVARGDNGQWLVDNDSKHLASAVLAMAGGDLKKQGSASLDIVHEYDWPGIALRAKKYYAKILGV